MFVEFFFWNILRNAFNNLYVVVAVVVEGSGVVQSWSHSHVSGLTGVTHPKKFMHVLVHGVVVVVYIAVVAPIVVNSVFCGGNVFFCRPAACWKPNWIATRQNKILRMIISFLNETELMTK